MVVPVVVNSTVRSGFRRYVMSVQYHGSSFLGFSIQHNNAENCVLSNGTDVRGYVSVERRIRLALSAMLSDNFNIKNINSTIDTSSDDSNCHFENVQVSSRTDRGVHAIKNTFHVDIRVNDNDEIPASEHVTATDDHEIDSRRKRKHLFQSTERMLRCMNYFLRRTNPTSPIDGLEDDNDERLMNDDPAVSTDGYSANSTKMTTHRRTNDTQYYCAGEWVRRCPAEEVRILAIKEAPLFMQNSTVGYEVYKQEKIVDWNVRFSAKSRTYMYRIMYSQNGPDWGIPFEWDRSWRIYDNNTNIQSQNMINIDDMRLAASYLVGTHDFSSFRATGCQRKTPIMTISDITIHMEPYDTYERLLMFGSLPTATMTSSIGTSEMHCDKVNGKCYIITIRYVGDAFLYRQVRKMTACLLAVGRGKMTPSKVRDILVQKDSGGAPYTAPPQGLYLVNVEHEGIEI